MRYLTHRSLYRELKLYFFLKIRFSKKILYLRITKLKKVIYYEKDISINFCISIG